MVHEPWNLFKLMGLRASDISQQLKHSFVRLGPVREVHSLFELCNLFQAGLKKPANMENLLYAAGLTRVPPALVETLYQPL